MIRYLFAAAIMGGAATYAMTSDIGLEMVPTGRTDPAKLEERVLASVAFEAPESVRQEMIKRSKSMKGFVSDKKRSQAILTFCDHNSSRKMSENQKCIREQRAHLDAMKSTFTVMEAVAGRETMLTALVPMYEEVFRCERRDHRSGEIDWKRTQQCTKAVITAMEDELAKLGYR